MVTEKRVPLLGYDGTYQTRGRSSRNGLFKMMLIDDFFLEKLRVAFPEDGLRTYPIFAQIALEKSVTLMSSFFSGFQFIPH
jgi:hypothetical protein